MEPEPPSAPLPEVVLPPHPQDRAHPREAVEHDGEERPVTEPGERARIDRLEELPRLRRREHRRRALGHDVLRTAHGGSRVHPEDLVDDEPVAEHANRGQVLLHRRNRSRMGPDVGGHVERGHGLEAEASRLAPPEKTAPPPARTPPASSRSRSVPRRTPGTSPPPPAPRR